MMSRWKVYNGNLRRFETTPPYLTFFLRSVQF